MLPVDEVGDVPTRPWMVVVRSLFPNTVSSTFFHCCQTNKMCELYTVNSVYNAGAGTGAVLLSTSIWC